MGIYTKEALDKIILNTKKVSYEMIPIEKAEFRISAENIFATYSLPPFNNSAMDGYAVKISDCGKKVKIIDTILAGSSKETQFSDGETIKIMTGARVPDSTEAIIPHELVNILDNNLIELPKEIKKNQNIRFIGEDIQKSDKILSDGDEINFSNITILASQGVTHIKVYRKPKVVVFASGEELKLHYETIKEYQIYNSNTPSLLSRVKELGGDVAFTGMAKDSLESLNEIISNSLYADLIITSGGVSVGDADFTKEAFNQFNLNTIFDGIIIKPGKPTVFGKIGNTYILNLPGNPLAASLIFELFGKIILQILKGDKNIYHNSIVTKMGQDLKNKKGRVTIIPGFFNGESFIASEKRSAGMVGILQNCNSMIILDENSDFIKKGETIKILPINWKFFTDKEKEFFN